MVRVDNPEKLGRPKAMTCKQEKPQPRKTTKNSRKPWRRNPYTPIDFTKSKKRDNGG